MNIIKSIVTIIFLLNTSLLCQGNKPETNNDDVSKYILVLVGSFIGSTIGYYFTRKKFQKDQLYLNKIETYKKLTDLLIDFNDKELYSEEFKPLHNKWLKLVSAFYKAHLFLPDHFTREMRAVINTVNSKIGSYIGFLRDKKIDNNLSKTKYMVFAAIDPLESENVEWEPSGPFINFDIYLPLIEKYHYILDFLKEDIDKKWYSSIKQKIKYKKNNRINKKPH